MDPDFGYVDYSMPSKSMMPTFYFCSDS